MDGHRVAGPPARTEREQPDATRAAGIEHSQIDSEVDYQIRDVGVMVRTECLGSALDLPDDPRARMRVLEDQKLGPDVGENSVRLGSGLDCTMRFAPVEVEPNPAAAVAVQRSGARQRGIQRVRQRSRSRLQRLSGAAREHLVNQPPHSRRNLRSRSDRGPTAGPVAEPDEHLRNQLLPARRIDERMARYGKHGHARSRRVDQPAQGGIDALVDAPDAVGEAVMTFRRRAS